MTNKVALDVMMSLDSKKIKKAYSCILLGKCSWSMDMPGFFGGQLKATFW